jgi:hypothetical protein
VIKFQRHPINKIHPTLTVFSFLGKLTILRCRLNERIFFKSLMDTFGSISLLIKRILFATNTVLEIQLH